MYLNFYELRKEPFSLAPDPEFLYLSQQHKDALGAIIYGIRAKQGFVSVVGEVGTGKTTIVRTYLHKAGRDKVLPIFIFNSRISFAELIETFLREIGIGNEQIEGMKTVNEMVMAAHRAMLEQGNTIVLIIDEAQNMPPDTLAKLCILSNFETNKAKLVQIILVGQPELQKKLALHELRQLRQRIAFRALITPLTEEDSTNYLHHRVSLVAKNNKPVFTNRAVKKIVTYSKGVPRVINVLCENSLVAGYGLQKKPVSLKIVKQVIAEHEGLDQSSPLQVRNLIGGTAALLIPLVFLLIYLPHFDSPKDLYDRMTSLANILDSRAEQDGSGSKNSETNGPKSASINEEIPPDGAIAASVAPANRPSSSTPADIDPPNRFWESFTLGTQHEPLNEPLTHEDDPFLNNQGQPAYFQNSRQGYESGQYSHLKVVQKGDTVSTLCEATYGFVNSRVLLWVKSHNPHISNLDEIRINEIIFFPEMKTPSFFKMPRSSDNYRSPLKEEIVSR